MLVKKDLSNTRIKPVQLKQLISVKKNDSYTINEVCNDFKLW